MAREVLPTHQKALEINLHSDKYGTFSEIGAGQEVVRWFFRVGGAAGTIAKSMSAYDMTVSDAIYGPCERYVSRQRLQAMLDYEYSLLVERLEAKRGSNTCFFAFADTVRAKGFQGASNCHGWMGVKFQHAPGAEPDQIILHVRMLDKEHTLQQEALGVVGVNLIHGAFYHYANADFILESLLDSLSTERVEVDMIKFSGPSFSGADERLMSLKLVQMGLSNAAMFAADGEILQPSEVLYKRPVLVERGSFRPPTLVNLDLLECARQQFVMDPRVGPDEPVLLMEITMRNLLATGEVDYADFLARADLLGACGATTLISNYFEYYRLAAYLATQTNRAIGLAMGIPSLKDLFEEEYYRHLEGGILEGFGRLFKNDLKLYVYPQKDSHTGQLINVQKLRVASHLQNLYMHLVENGYLESIDYYNRDYLDIYSRDVLRRIAAGDASWERMVPPQVAEHIKRHGFFGYSARPLAAATP